MINNNWTWDTFELPCFDGRKSFYRKAIVFRLTNTNDYILESYGTQVAAFINNQFVRLWDGYSYTTMRHINSFLKFLCLPGGGKSWWESLSIERIR